MADIDKDGVRVYGDAVNIAVCKEIGGEARWSKSEMIYMPEGLKELVELKNRA